MDIMDRRKTFYSEEDVAGIKEDLLEIRDMINKKLEEIESNVLF